ncbi:hypothetical protein D3C75_1185830 [compost metagenome]
MSWFKISPALLSLRNTFTVSLASGLRRNRSSSWATPSRATFSLMTVMREWAKYSCRVLVKLLRATASMIVDPRSVKVRNGGDGPPCPPPPPPWDEVALGLMIW